MMEGMFDKDGAVGSGECLPDVSMYAAFNTDTDMTGKTVE
jgi:hypothetical protein